MNRNLRLELLRKVAASKDLKGILKKKDVLSILDKAKSSYHDSAKRVSTISKQIEQLVDAQASSEEELESSRNKVKKCYEILELMDFEGATEVKVSGDSIKYKVGNKWKAKEVPQKEKSDDNDLDLDEGQEVTVPSEAEV